MRYVVCAALLALAPAQGFAWVKVTNLSGQPQSVTFSQTGEDATRTIQPNETVQFVGGAGMLSLNGAAAIQKAQNAKPGILGQALGDVVASNRTSRIPAEAGNGFVIWPDGRLMIQQRRTMQKRI